MKLDAEIAALFDNFQRSNNEFERAAAERDPNAHKLSRVMAGPHGLNYHYAWGGKNGRNQTLWFCWSTHRNVAGYFLGWREVRGKRKVRRDRWVARKSRIAVKKLAQRRAEQSLKKAAPRPGA